MYDEQRKSGTLLRASPPSVPQRTRLSFVLLFAGVAHGIEQRSTSNRSVEWRITRPPPRGAAGSYVRECRKMFFTHLHIDARARSKVDVDAKQKGLLMSAPR